MAKSKGQEGKKKKVNAKDYDIELTAKAEKVHQLEYEHYPVVIERLLTEE